MKLIWQIFSRLLASLLSVLLFLSLILIPFISFITDTIEPGKLVDLIFASGILDQLSAPSSGHHNILLSNGTADTGSDPELEKLIDTFKDRLSNGEMTAKELIFALSDKLNSGELDAATLTKALQELIDSGAVDAKQVLSAFGLPDALYQTLLAADGSIDLSSLVNTFQALMGSGLLDVETLLEEIGIPADTPIDTESIMKNLAKSDAAKELIATYAEDVLNAATGEDKNPKLTADTVLHILQPHMEEIANIVKDSLPEDVEIDNEKLESAINKAASTVLPSLVDSLPSAENMANTIVDHENPAIVAMMNALKFVRNGYLRLAAIGVAAALSLFIFLLRLPGFSGLRWVGSEVLSSALIIGALAFFLQTQQMIDILRSFANEATVFVTPLLSELSTAFVPFAIIYGVAALVLIVGSKILDATFDRD